MGLSTRDDADQEWDGLRRILDLLPIYKNWVSRYLLTVGEDVHYLYDALLPDLQILTFRLAWLPSPDEDSDLGSDGGSGLTITTTMEGQEGGVEERRRIRNKGQEKAMMTIKKKRHRGRNWSIHGVTCLFRQFDSLPNAVSGQHSTAILRRGQACAPRKCRNRGSFAAANPIRLRF
jgi:hypothetical protein